MALTAVAVGAALVLGGAVHLPGTTGSGNAQGGEAHRPSRPDTVVTTDQPAPRPLSVDAPLRLWIGGDSLAGSLGPSLGLMTAQTGVVQPQFDSRVSSGLANSGFFDWPRHATQEMERLHPEAVVFIVDTNDAPIVPRASLRAGSSTTTTNPAAVDWRADYARRVDDMMKIFIGDGQRTVYWVGAPVMKDPARAAGVRALDEIARDVASRHPEVTYVDTYDLFSDSNGKYTTSLPGLDGNSVLVRAGDGIHLTPAGGDRMARAVFGVIDARWRIRAQAVPGHVLRVLETQGSSQVPGTGRKVGAVTPATSGSRGTTTTTVQPATSTTAASTTTAAASSSTSSSTPPPPH